MLENNKNEECEQTDNSQSCIDNSVNLNNEKPQQEQFSGEMIEVDFESIEFCETQPRQYFDEDDLESLKQSISEVGLVQPIVIRKSEGDKYEVVAGERRRRAIEALRTENKNNEFNRFQKIKVLLINDKYEEIAIIENVIRTDITWVELAEALDKLSKKKKMTQEELGELIGKKKSSASEILSINKIDKQILDEARNDKNVPQHLLIKIAKIKDKEEQKLIWENYKKKSTTKKDAKNQEETTKNNEPAMLFMQYKKATKSALTQIQKFDFNYLNQEQKKDLEKEMKDLQTTIKNLLKEIQLSEDE